MIVALCDFGVFGISLLRYFWFSRVWAFDVWLAIFRMSSISRSAYPYTHQESAFRDFAISRLRGVLAAVFVNLDIPRFGDVAIWISGRRCLGIFHASMIRMR